MVHIIFFLNIVLISHKIVDDVVQEDGQLLGGLKVSWEVLDEWEKEVLFLVQKLNLILNNILGRLDFDSVLLG